MKRLCPIVEHMVSKGVSAMPIEAYNQPFQEMVILSIFTDYFDKLEQYKLRFAIFMSALSTNKWRSVFRSAGIVIVLGVSFIM